MRSRWVVWGGVLVVGCSGAAVNGANTPAVASGSPVEAASAPTSSASAASPVASTPPAPLTIEPPGHPACKLEGKQVWDPDDRIERHYTLSVAGIDDSNFTRVYWEKDVQFIQLFAAGVAGSHLIVEGEGLRIHGHVRAPLVYAKTPLRIAVGVELNGNHPLKVTDVSEEGKLSFDAELPFAMTGELHAQLPCDQLNTHPTLLPLPPPKGYERPSGKRKIGEDDAIWVSNPGTTVKLSGPLTVLTFGRPGKEKLLANFGTGQLSGPVIDPPPMNMMKAPRLAMGFAIPRPVDTRACDAELALQTRLDDGRFVRIGTIAPGRPVVVLRAEGPQTRVHLPVRWLQGDSYHVESSALAGCKNVSLDRAP